MTALEDAGELARKGMLSAAYAASEEVIGIWPREWRVLSAAEAFMRESVVMLANCSAVRESRVDLRQRYVLQMLLELVAGSHEAVTSLVLALPRSAGGNCRRMVELVTFAAILYRSDIDIAGRWHDHVAEQIDGVLSEMKRSGEEAKVSLDAYVDEEKKAAIDAKTSTLKDEYGSNLLTYYGWAQGGKAADDTLITKKQAGGLPSLMHAAGYDVLIPIYKHLSQMYVHATALSMQGHGGTGHVGTVHIGPAPQDPDLEFLAKCVLCVLDKAAGLMGEIAAIDEQLRNPEIVAAAEKAGKLITIAVNMLQERGDELHGPMTALPS